MATKKEKKIEELARNIILIVLAVGVVVIFFNLDIMKKGESMFSRQGSVKLRFKGDLGKDDYSDAEEGDLLSYLNKYKDVVTSAVLETRLEDSYRKVTANSQIIFEVHLTMTDGSVVSTPARRAKRSALIPGVLQKLDKDLSAYRKLKNLGKEMKKLINTSWLFPCAPDTMSS